MFTVEGAGHFGLGKVGELAKFTNAHVAAGGLVEADADALEQALAGFVAVAGELGGLHGVNDDLSHKTGYFGV